MSEPIVFDAPDVDVPPSGDDKWNNEYRSFLTLRSSLSENLKGKYIAVHEGRVVDSGESQIAVAQRVYAKFGYVPIYVGLVVEEPMSWVRIPSPLFHTSSPLV